MTGIDRRSLQQDLEEFDREKERIRAVIGQIGDLDVTRRDRVMGTGFVVLLGCLVVLDLVRYLFGVLSSLPPMFFVVLGGLLVSIGVLWMLYKRTQVEHFRFWILNSIGFRLTDLASRVRRLDRVDPVPPRTRGRSRVRRELLRVEVERAARVCRTNRDAGRALGVTEHTFVLLCRGYGIELPDDRKQRRRKRTGRGSPE